MNNDRSKVFDYEHCSPGDLGTEIFDGDSALVEEADVTDGGALLRGHDRAIAALCDAQAVDRGTCRARDFLVQLLCRVGRGNRDLLGELFDGLAWRRE